MAEDKAGQPFGMDPAALAKIDWSLALKRIVNDLRSDFIYAPHLALIFSRSGEELAAGLSAELKAGGFSPGVPLTIEVPKSFRIRVAAPSKRLGPAFSRPGSILLPKDRLLYQVLADEAAPVINAKTDYNRSFSHRLAPEGSATMFVPTRICWNELQKALAKHASVDTSHYVLKIDIANFFGSINQHTLINVLRDSGYSPSFANRLEPILTSYMGGDRSSRGILQGMYPSDLFGNFYMAPMDRFFDESSLPSVRYVDDIYVFVDSVDSADRLMRDLIPFLRTYDLVLNEAKCVLIPKGALNTEEPDLEALFNSAVEEISEQIEEEDFDAGYGFQSDWDDGNDGGTGAVAEELELKATKLLFDSISEYTGHEENIERFCLPLFTKASSDYAVKHVLDSFKKRPAMSQMYAAYLAKFLSVKEVETALLELIIDDSLGDWQKMWVLATLLQTESSTGAALKAAWNLLKEANRHEALRAVAAIYVGRFGDIIRRKALVALYPNVSPYIQTAIYFSSRWWPGVERSNAKASWGSHGPLNSLLTVAFTKKLPAKK